ncbi:MAG: bifunctional phosphopantothenoylcysteine decarboxylase/phosphopantothenate synthase [Planctomycetia bacterium]|nr:bifunctional phosphopantothenoylcysteine decarboxylase/phosphopantothenate synthase [Planctomycetia bacterium]
MQILVTAGNTQTPIDKVRCITNVFTGRTGTGIALHAHQRGHDVILLTSHPEVVAEVCEADHLLNERFRVRRYRTFDDLHAAMMEQIRGQPLDAIIHCAAVSDYRAAGIFVPQEGTRFQEADAMWAGTPPRLHDVTAGKVKSDAPELWLRLVRTPKLVDLIRRDWSFRGVLVKFKLEVGVSDERLLEIAEKSRVQSMADLLAANTLEGAATWAFLGPLNGQYQRVPRRELAQRLLEAVEAVHRERQHG